MVDKLKEDISKFAERVKNHYEQISTEEATKTALIMPFIQLMGYDVFNPSEVIPEFTADVGIKNGEKVDYAIFLGQKPIMLIECKCSKEPLSVNHEAQLFRYFHTTDAKFALLTNGIEFRFYTDLDAPNKMDKVPFLEFSMLSHDKIRINELLKLTKENFDAESIRKSADHFKRVTAVRKVIEEDLKNPSEEYIKTIFKKVSPAGAMFSDSRKNSITQIVKSVMRDVINDIVKENLENALDATEATADAISKATAPPETKTNDVVTSQEEIEAYLIVKSILRQIVPVDTITMQDFKSYCAVYYGKPAKPVCRLYFNNLANLRIGLNFKNNEEKYTLTNVDDIFAYADKIKKVVEQYL